MSMSATGNLLRIWKEEVELAQILVISRGVMDASAVSALLGGLDAVVDGLQQRFPGLRLEQSFESGWLGSPAGQPPLERPYRFQVPIRILYEEETGSLDHELLSHALVSVLRGYPTLFPEPYTGGVVPGADRVEREETLRRLQELLDSGLHVMVTAPRRYGKTTLLYALMERMPEGRGVFFLDVQNVASPLEFAVRVDVALDLLDGLSGARTGVGSLAEVVEQRLEEESRRYDEFVDEVAARARRLSGPTVLILDEVTYMLENVGKRKARRVLSLISRLERSSGALRLVLAASTDLRAYLEAVNLSLGLSAVTEVQLPPLSAETASLLVRSLFARAGLRPSSAVVNMILELASPPVPFFLQVLVFELQAELRSRPAHIDEAWVREVYRRRVIGPESRRWFDAFEYHLGRYYEGDNGLAARLVLGELCRRDEPMTTRRIGALLRAHGVRVRNIGSLMRRLCFDMYVAQSRQPKGYIWANRMLRDYWFEFHATHRR